MRVGASRWLVSACAAGLLGAPGCVASEGPGETATFVMSGVDFVSET